MRGMSYCRWSSDNWMSDVYVYEDVSGGWTTHVAGRRRPFGPVPDLMSSRLTMALHGWSGCIWDRERREMVYPQRWRGAVYHAWCSFLTFWHNRVHMGSLRLIPLRQTGLPADGESFNDPTPTDCADRLEGLRAMGYRVPQYAIDALRSEVLDA
jgi:hypothetical protein